MFFLVEQYWYEVTALNCIFGNVRCNEDIPLKIFAGDNIYYTKYENGKYVKFDYVGYCHYTYVNKDNIGKDDWIFFLPKVVLDQEIEDNCSIDYTTTKSDEKKEESAIQKSKKARILKKYSPEKYLSAEKIKTESLDDYLYLLQLSVSVSRAIGVYRKRLLKSDSKTVMNKQSVVNIRAELNGRPQSFLDILDSLDKFAKENQDYFMFLSQDSHNQHKRINWYKTIQNTVPIIQKKRPLYLNPVTSKKEVDFDEELLVLFNSILNFINKTFQYNSPVNEGYELIQGASFTNYLNGYGHRRLQQIRYKYYTDKALTLWKLCDEFFIHKEASSDRITEEYILAKGFHKVFEGVMDRLIGDDELSKYKVLKDGKVIDHLYCDKSLINPAQDLYFIADSKYYAINAAIGNESRYKQFTYASGIQNEWINKPPVRIMDPDTYGYDIIPNYLISAKIPESQRKRMSTLLEPDDSFNGEKKKVLLEHVSNSLFAGSTKFIFKFSVDFKYVIDLYGRDKDNEIQSFKLKAHKLARDYALSFYDGLFRFFWFNELPKTCSSEKDLLVLNYKAGDKEGSPAFLIMIGRIYSYLKGDKKQYVVAVARDDVEDSDVEYKNESRAIINALETEGFISSADGVFKEEYTLQDIQKSEIGSSHL